LDIFTFVPHFGNLFMTLLAFVAALSVIVAIHEYGHYIVGRWCGIKAEVFSLGFGPVLWSSRDRHGTLWQLAALPFGGFVKFMGDATAASGTASDDYQQMPPELRRQTMHGAPLWARTATVAAGPVFNFVLSILIFAGVMMFQGQVAEPLAVGKVKPLPYDGITLRPGDELLRIEGSLMPSTQEEEDVFEDFIDTLPQQALLDYQVRRNGETIDVKGPYPMPPLIVQLAPKSAAYDIDLKQGDVIVEVEGSPIVAFQQLKDVVESSNGRPLELRVWRDGRILDFVLAPRRVDEPQDEGGFATKWRIGIAGGLAYDLATERLRPGEAFRNAAAQTWRVVEGSFSGLYHMITGAISSCNMTGPIGIAEVSGAMASQGVESFIWFIAVLSTAVGLLNLFPIPVLDGGHMMFATISKLSGRQLPRRFMEVTQGSFVILFLCFFLYVTFFDVGRVGHELGFGEGSAEQTESVPNDQSAPQP